MEKKIYMAPFIGPSLLKVTVLSYFFTKLKGLLTASTLGFLMFALFLVTASVSSIGSMLMPKAINSLLDIHEKGCTFDLLLARVRLL